LVSTSIVSDWHHKVFLLLIIPAMLEESECCHNLKMYSQREIEKPAFSEECSDNKYL
jgi:hypothetical protein